MNKLHLYFGKKTSSAFNHHSFKNGYFVSCFVLILLMGCLRSSPIYGKLDFLSLNSKPWWEGWRQMIQEVMEDKKTPVLSDRATSKVLNGIFNIPESKKFENKVRKGDINIHSLANFSNDESYRFIVNLQGFEPSWVSYETHHWSHDYADPFLNYRYKNKYDEELIKTLKNSGNKNYIVYY